MKNLTIILESRPGTIALMIGALASRGINIYGISSTLYEKHEVINLLIEDAKQAQETLEEANINVLQSRDVLIWDIKKLDMIGKPGALSEFLYIHRSI
ncbi:MAG: hypothetical protein ACW99A_19830 [Candidatus Kariarchaeaceae archaeon]